MTSQVSLNLQNEFTKKYQNCVIRLMDRETSEDVYRMAHSFEISGGDETNPTGRATLGRIRQFQGRLKWYPELHDVSKFVWLGEKAYPYPLGMVNCGEHVACVARRPRRQWCRGACMENTSIDYPATALMGGWFNERLGSSSPYLLNFVLETRGQFPSFEEAVHRLKNGKAYSVAFGQRYWVSLSAFHSSLVLGYKYWPVGRVTPKTSKVFLSPECLPLMEDLSQYVADVQPDD